MRWDQPRRQWPGIIRDALIVFVVAFIIIVVASGVPT